MRGFHFLISDGKERHKKFQPFSVHSHLSQYKLNGSLSKLNERVRFLSYCFKTG